MRNLSTLNQKVEKKNSFGQSKWKTQLNQQFLLRPMIILQEKDGMFGPLVRRNLFTNPEGFVLPIHLAE